MLEAMATGVVEYAPQMDHLRFKVVEPKEEMSTDWMVTYAKKVASDKQESDLINLLRSVEDLSPHITGVSEMQRASGARGTIWEGRYKNAPVALKTIIQTRPGKQVKHLIRELESWRRLHNPNIVELLGLYNYGAYGPAMVAPWMDFGNLRDYLKTTAQAAYKKLLLDIGNGLVYLHSLRPAVVHGDLRAANVLVGAHHEARLADFGLASILHESEEVGEDEDDVSHSRSETSGNPRWMSPERLIPENYNLTRHTAICPASDTWSFGMVVYEMYTGLVPFQYLGHAVYSIGLAILEGKRPQYPEDMVGKPAMEPALRGIVEQCWRQEWNERPSAAGLVESLKALL